MPERWSRWAAVIVLGQVAGLIGYELWALSRDQDAWPTITAMTMAAIRKNWAIGAAILGTLVWLVVHFGRRWVKLREQEKDDKL